jgi:aspartyl-tRNA(Asn)/glutamyl-tRNA(Gln) amidotransferase subunit B
MKESLPFDRYETIVGLEVHAQLRTHTKAFAPEETEYGGMPNTQISPITLALPGTLPVLNQKAVEYALLIGLACKCDITRHNFFARKNYFYPDLPKGFQISQDKTPLCTGGRVKVKLKDGTAKTIALTRIHMEEDAGKSLHLDGHVDTLVDFNRAGIPLIEIVSEPDMRSSEEAYAYLTEIRRLVRYLDICDGNMEEGSLRCDANVSVRLRGTTAFGSKVEVKNMNSIRNVQRAIEYEVSRQIALIEAGESIVSETRNFDSDSGKTFSMRSKENLNDYRYFPEPDLPPLVISDSYLEQVRMLLPPLPDELFEKFTSVYQLPEYDAGVLTDSKDIALYFEAVCKHTAHFKAASNWVMGPVKSYLNELTLGIEQFPLAPAAIAGIITLIDEGKLSHSLAMQKLWPALLEAPDLSPSALAEKLNLLQVSDEGTLAQVVKEVLEANPAKVAEYKAGKRSLIGMFMGEIMKKTQGKADPKRVNELLTHALE